MSMETIKTEYQSELALVEDAKQLSEFWAKYLGKGGQVQALKMCLMKKRKHMVRQ